jgi:hypothetical protein
LRARWALATPPRPNCLIFKHSQLKPHFQYAKYPIVFYGLFQQEKLIGTDLNKYT